MKSRCLNPRNPDYPDYGGRGILPTDEWCQSYLNFVRDMGERLPGMSLDRIDVNLGYFKENCRWTTASEQAFNKRHPRRFYDLDDNPISVHQIAHHLAMTTQTYLNRRQKSLARA